MNSTLEHNLYLADGRYFTDLELQPLEIFLSTYAIRLRTYQLLQEQADTLIETTLNRLASTDRDTVQKYKDTCKRDMSYVVRAIAVALLRDDAEAFNQQLVLWMQNIMIALKKEAQSARAYKLLQTLIQEQLPSDNARLVNELLELFIAALMV